MVSTDYISNMTARVCVFRWQSVVLQPYVYEVTRMPRIYTETAKVLLVVAIIKYDLDTPMYIQYGRDSHLIYKLMPKRHSMFRYGMSCL